MSQTKIMLMARTYGKTEKIIEGIVRQVIKEERERCAKIAEEFRDKDSNKYANVLVEIVAKEIAKAIREQNEI